MNRPRVKGKSREIFKSLIFCLLLFVRNHDWEGRAILRAVFSFIFNSMPIGSEDERF